MRTAPAIVGGFVVANLTSIALAAAMPVDRGDAVMASIIASFVFYCAAVDSQELRALRSTVNG